MSTDCPHTKTCFDSHGRRYCEACGERREHGRDPEGEPMYNAIDLQSNTDFKFKSMATLMKRFGGDTYVVRRDRSVRNAHMRTVDIIAHLPDGGVGQVATLRVDAEAIPEHRDPRPVGRPSLGDRRTIGLKMPVDLLNRVADVAEAKKLTRTDAVRRALTEWIERNG